MIICLGSEAVSAPTAFSSFCFPYMIITLTVICMYKAGGSSTEPGQGGTSGVSNVPDEEVQTIPSPNIESEQDDDTSSMAGEQPQVEEQPTQSGNNGGFDLNKLPPR